MAAPRWCQASMPCRREDSLRRMGAAHTDQGLVTVVALCCRRRVVKVTDGSHSVWMDGPPLANPTPTVSLGMGDSQSEKNVLESVNTGGVIAAPCFPSTRRVPVSFEARAQLSFQ